MDPKKDQEIAKEVEKENEAIEKEVQEELKDERPEINYKAELERKNRELERLRMEVVSRQEQPRQRDPNDISTWSDHELKAIVTSNDPSVMPYKEKANDILLDRKVDARLARQAETTKRVTAEMQLREKYPEALDPTSDLAIRMDKIIAENDLSKTPAGRLVAAKLAFTELNQGKSASDARANKNEQDRVSRVKGQMVDGDRAKPTDSPSKDLESKRKTLAEKLLSTSLPGGKNDDESTQAMSEILKDRFGGREGFFSKK